MNIYAIRVLPVRARAVLWSAIVCMLLFASQGCHSVTEDEKFGLGKLDGSLRLYIEDASLNDAMSALSRESGVSIDLHDNRSMPDAKSVRRQVHVSEADFWRSLDAVGRIFGVELAYNTDQEDTKAVVYATDHPYSSDWAWSLGSYRVLLSKQAGGLPPPYAANTAPKGELFVVLNSLPGQRIVGARWIPAGGDGHLHSMMPAFAGEFNSVAIGNMDLGRIAGKDAIRMGGTIEVLKAQEYARLTIGIDDQSKGFQQLSPRDRGIGLGFLELQRIDNVHTWDWDSTTQPVGASSPEGSGYMAKLMVVGLPDGIIGTRLQDFAILDEQAGLHAPTRVEARSTQTTSGEKGTLVAVIVPLGPNYYLPAAIWARLPTRIEKEAIDVTKMILYRKP